MYGSFCGGRILLSGYCTSAMFPIKLSGEPINALLDSGAGPSVIDKATVHELGLEPHLEAKDDEIYGLSHEPVKVIGKVELTVDLGDGQVLEHTFDILADTGPELHADRNL